MLRKKDSASFEDFKKHGFKYGAREKFIYKTKQNGIESSIYIDLLPCHNNNNEVHIQSSSYSLPEKIADVLYDLIQEGSIERVKKNVKNKR